MASAPSEVLTMVNAPSDVSTEAQTCYHITLQLISKQYHRATRCPQHQWWPLIHPDTSCNLLTSDGPGTFPVLCILYSALKSNSRHSISFCIYDDYVPLLFLYLLPLIRPLTHCLLMHASNSISCTSYIFDSMLISLNLNLSLALLIFPSSTHLLKSIQIWGLHAAICCSSITYQWYFIVVVLHLSTSSTQEKYIHFL